MYGLPSFLGSAGRRVERGVLSCRAANSNLKGVKVTSRKPRRRRPPCRPPCRRRRRPSIHRAADIGAFRRLMVS